MEDSLLHLFRLSSAASAWQNGQENEKIEDVPEMIMNQNLLEKYVQIEVQKQK